MVMIRTITFALFLFSAVAVKAQSFGAFNPAFSHFRQLPDTGALQKKWSITKYVGITAGYSTLMGSFIFAPVGLQLNRRLTDNVYAFAGVSVAPTLYQFNNAFYQPKTFGNSNTLGINPRAELGLMYVNDERTFSISGSIGVSRGYYNYGYAPFYGPVNSGGLRNGKAY